MKNIKFFLISFLFTIQLGAFAQFNYALIGVDGLTCSACTRSVEMSIRKLSFVDSVTMNLEHTEGKIIFKKGAKVEVDKIAKAVVDAGFSLRSLYAGVNFDHLKLSNDLCWMFDGNNYHFVKIANDTELNGIVTVKFIGEKFMSKKEFKNWKMYCTNNCSVPSSQTTPNSKSYYVSLL
ncbi:MAG: heavy-metal-associated domain-containing protein [Bacteroidia bacterium]